MRTFRIVESAFSYSSCDRKNAKQDCIWHRDPHHGGITVLQVKVTMNIKDQRGWLVPVHSQERINPQQVRLGQNEVNSRLAFLVSLGGASTWPEELLSPAAQDFCKFTTDNNRHSCIARYWPNQYDLEAVVKAPSG